MNGRWGRSRASCAPLLREFADPPGGTGFYRCVKCAPQTRTCGLLRRRAHTPPTTRGYKWAHFFGVTADESKPNAHRVTDQKLPASVLAAVEIRLQCFLSARLEPTPGHGPVCARRALAGSLRRRNIVAGQQGRACGNRTLVTRGSSSRAGDAGFEEPRTQEGVFDGTASPRPGDWDKRPSWGSWTSWLRLAALTTLVIASPPVVRAGRQRRRFGRSRVWWGRLGRCPAAGVRSVPGAWYRRVDEWIGLGWARGLGQW